MRISLLTSSRADFGIQLPLLKALRRHPDMPLRIIAFGSHDDPRYGRTVQQIRGAGFEPALVLPPVLDDDTPAGIARAMARTMEQFAQVWSAGDTDMIIALGDRYEMFAAVAASTPFNIPVTHLHGGETTLGAMDESFRHAITHMARLHFTAAEPYRQRVVQLLGHGRGVVNTGALSIDNLASLQLLDIKELKSRFGVDLSVPTALVTLHPETIQPELNRAHTATFIAVLRAIEERYRVLVTMPNADTHASHLRSALEHYLLGNTRAQGVESLGTIGYLSCMSHAAFMIGNSSSGFIEASFFPKHVIDVGERQTGRLVTPNIQRVPFDTERLLSAVKAIEAAPVLSADQPYGDGKAADKMVNALRAYAGLPPRA